MYKTAIRMVLAGLILAAVAGCEASCGPRDEPGSIRASVHGQAAVGAGGRL
jgi:hypothetical protein